MTEKSKELERSIFNYIHFKSTGERIIAIISSSLAAGAIGAFVYSYLMSQMKHVPEIAIQMGQIGTLMLILLSIIAIGTTGYLSYMEFKAREKILENIDELSLEEELKIQGKIK